MESKFSIQDTVPGDSAGGDTDLDAIRLCSAHQLPMGDDGLCIQCRREYELSQSAQSHSGYQVFVNLLGVLLVLGGCAAFGYFFAWPWWQQQQQKKQAEAVLEDPDPSVTNPHALVSSDYDAGVVERRWGRPTWQRRSKKKRPVYRPHKPKLEIHTTKRERREQRNSLRPQYDQPEVKIIKVDEGQPAAGTPRATPRPAPARTVSGASRRVRVLVYVTSWCPACRQARAWLANNKVRHQVLDVQRNKRASRQLRRLNPRGTIPTFKIGRQVLVGFSPRQVRRAILRAANR